MSPHAHSKYAQERFRVLRHAARKVIFERGTDLDLERIARLSGTDVAVARELFGDGQGLRQALYVHTHDCLNGIIGRERGALPPDASAMQRLRNTLLSYFHFATEKPDCYLVHLAFEAENGAGPVDGVITAHPVLSLIINDITDVVAETGMSAPEEDIMALSLTVFSAVHGYNHLCAYANSRHLVASAKKHTMNAILDAYFDGFRQYLVDPDVDWIAPSVPAESAFQTPLDYSDYPRDTIEGKTQRLIRSGIRRIRDESLSAVSLRGEAERAGVPVSEAKALFDGDDDFCAKIEQALEHDLAACIAEQVAVLPENATALNSLKATGFGTLMWALRDPVGLLALSQVMSGSVVPVGAGFADDSTIIIRAILAALHHDGADLSQEWATYVKIFTIWSTFHGIVHLTSVGAAAYLPEQTKFELANVVMDLAICTIVERFGLDRDRIAPD